MNLLQVSAPKSGSFWLNTILKKILKQKDQPISYYIRSRPEYEWLKNENLSFKDQAGVDMMDIEEDAVYFRVSSLFREKIPDLKKYTEKSTLAWTHSTWCDKTAEVFAFFDRKVCIVRDPRDTALSAAKFAFTPYMQKHYPTPYPSEEAFFIGELERLLDQWVWFYGNYLLQKDELDLHFVFYENLLRNFKSELDSLLDYLNISLTAENKQKIAEAVSFSSMKTENPRHLQKGTSNKWIEKFSSEEIKLASEKAGELMKILNYPLTPDAAERSPSVPKDLPKQQLEELLKKIDWRSLY